MIRDLQPDRDRVEAYVEGRLTGDDLAAFERSLADQPSLRAQVELLVRIEASVRRVADPPPLERLAAIADDAVRTHRADTMRPAPRRWLAVAAGLAAAVVGGWLIVAALRQPGGAYDAGPRVTFAQAYHQWADQGFQPQWVCKDDQEFADTFRTAFGQGLVPLEPPAGVRLLGLAYCHSLSRGTIGVLAVVDGRPVAVFIDRADRDAEVEPPGDLRQFRTRHGRLVLYELTPWDEPRLTPLLGDPPSSSS